ncbi:CDP-glycerol glycerophosphotransferase family protein [Sediminibacillus dalangtanensis]|uniref:CDP-glycerol glycerophosphotransferase family protein n=1 Tax=Sediminibacillus dalangtanensis TaxID=2729421 RepID=A0ABX7VW93_9BACI|nr:CDP-glycerol glycerophosphotransferase family protein [Sediminibacillus dalangtanensis]
MTIRSVKGEKIMAFLFASLYNIMKRIYVRIYRILFCMMTKLPPNKNLVVFESFLGKQYSDNPRAIYEYMKEHDMDFTFYWSVDKRNEHLFQGRGLNTVRRLSLRWLLIMPRAKYWITNSRLPLWIPKPKHTTYVQTWHGTPLKKLAADMREVHMPGTTTEKYKRNFTEEAAKWDYLVSPNQYSSEIFRRAFRFNKTMIESGYPRNDYLYYANTTETIKDLKQKYDLPLDKKIVLYAPTWRDNQFHKKGRYKFDNSLDLSKMKEELGSKYILLLRMHYLVAENLNLSDYEGFAYDFSRHEDIRELYLMADVLVTDYSSVFFDYANLHRPIIFYVYDIDEYRDKLRGFYFDIEEQAPGPLVKTTEGVIDEINRAREVDVTTDKIYQDFYQRFCGLESGDAAKQVVDIVFEDN